MKPAPLTVLDADSVVNAPVDAVVAPMETLFSVPAVAGLTVTVPVPVGDSTTLALGGLSVTVLDAVMVVKAAVLGEVEPSGGGTAK